MRWLLFLSSLLALGAPLLAAPISKRQDRPALEPADLEILKTHAKYASAAYCPQAKLERWSCGKDCVGRLNVTSYFSDKSTGIAGYLGYSRVEKKIVISFRGTSNLANWAKNLAFAKDRFIYPTASDKVKVHGGFYDTYMSVEKKVRLELKNILTALKNETGSYKLIFTGHSLGGAVASLSAMDVKRFYLNPKSGKCFKPDLLIIDRSQIYLHTYGQPRTGNKEFSQLVYETFGKNNTHKTLARITHANDPVPRLPPQKFGYLHHPHEVYIRKDGSTVVCEDVVNGKVTEDSSCIIKVLLPVGIKAHSRYWDTSIGTTC
ncbi:alpha/beta-hydrolase [Basidiobolus meristosporus CBS 931.73]|uniref:Alpha/beta-hydrolase n=1 Tax=Basidiobolus meristosporus CBS 931.73 TaxID=1314790 RepID=A0A1Y1Y9Z3_9FUNG|nr:alpha/beta-hydrolase [Basidiobolus meristosporus CBS 931.73]|eukprot:ORX94831.1 alpha/beta-hydrolase [Basidiobolus meristosporus CBS 931.73]